MSYFGQRVYRDHEKSGPCPVCGKRAVRRKRFWQPLGPDNKNPDGHNKRVDQIVRELRAEGDAWVALPVMHVGCERGAA